jgi:thiamine monophosphate kinase
MAGGDDYELLWTVRPRGRGRFRAVARRFHHLRLTRIGSVMAGSEVLLRRDGRDEPLAPGFSHFR